MYRIIFGIVFILMSYATFSQSKSELGFYGGAAYYLGDINPTDHFQPSNVAVGGIYRYNFNSRYALRAGMLFTSLEGSDFDAKASFSTDVVDLSLQVEFNFQPFQTPKKTRTKKFSPYVTAGIGYIAPTSTTSSITIPMGIGFKYCMGKRWTAALEWSFRKTFTDDLDNLDDPNLLGESSLLHNNDWSSFAGIIISYKLFPDNTECHSYGR